MEKVEPYLDATSSLMQSLRVPFKTPGSDSR